MNNLYQIIYLMLLQCYFTHAILTSGWQPPWAMNALESEFASYGKWHKHKQSISPKTFQPIIVSDVFPMEAVFNSYYELSNHNVFDRHYFYSKCIRNENENLTQILYCFTDFTKTSKWVNWTPWRILFLFFMFSVIFGD